MINDWDIDFRALTSIESVDDTHCRIIFIKKNNQGVKRF